MLTPEYLDGLTDDILAMYDALSETIIEDMSRRIVKTGMSLSGFLRCLGMQRMSLSDCLRMPA